MAFTFHLSNTASNDAAGASLTVQLTGVTAGDLIVAWMKWETNDTAATFAETTGGSQAADGYGALGNTAAGATSSRFAFILAGTSGTITYTMTTNAAADFRRIDIFAYSYSGTASKDGSDANILNTTTALSSGNITTTGTDGVAFGGYGETGGSTISAEQINAVAADQIIGGPTTAAAWSKTYVAGFTGAATATLSGSVNSLVGIIAFKATAGGGAPAPPIQSQLLVGNLRW